MSCFNILFWATEINRLTFYQITEPTKYHNKQMIPYCSQFQDYDSFFASITVKGTHSTDQIQFDKESSQKQCIGSFQIPQDQNCSEQNSVNVMDFMFQQPVVSSLEEIKEENSISIGEEQVHQQTNGKQTSTQDFLEISFQEQIKSQNTQIFDKILKSFDIRSNKQKNTNFPKFLVRLLQKHFQKIGKSTQTSWEKLKFIHSRIKRLKYRNKNMNISIIKEIVGDQVTLEEQKVCSRRVVRKVLRNRIKKQIIQNNHIITKKNYMIASKVYALRCQSGGLVDRVKSK